MRRLESWFGLVTLLLALPVCGQDAAGTRVIENTFHTIFEIRKSTNSNYVVYEACLNAEGEFCEDPVQMYWVMKAKDGSRESLTGLEKFVAYGISISEANADRITFVLKALPDRAITISREEAAGRWAVRASMAIGGQTGELKEVYVESGGGWPIPEVKYIEVKGLNGSTGKKLSERIPSGN